MIQILQVQVEGLASLQLKGRLDQRTRGLFEGMIEQLLQQGERHIGIDLRKAQALDSEGAEALVAVDEQVTAAGGQLVIFTS